uniref:Uncharacterized protein n=1 Tax=Periophthalmus magnuspinnatus TaxID=409849 RepID=A0A3B3ZIA7_9GOBI
GNITFGLLFSMSLCEIPEAEPEVVQKYNEMKQTFFKRLENAYNKMKAAAGDTAASEYTQKALADMDLAPYAQVAKAVGEEISPAVDNARSAALGFYSKHLRPYVREYLEDGITRIKAVLDQVLPVEN